MRRFIILGATGSIGTQALDIIRLDRNIKLVAFSFGENLKKACEIIDEFKPSAVSCKDKKNKEILQAKYPNIEFFDGDLGLVKIATYQGGDTVINALVGACGLRPTYEAIRKNKDILLANKETLVIGGSIIMPLVKQNGVKLYPLDSEHSAIFQLINEKSKKQINRLLITASGGSLRDYKKEELENVSIGEVLNHPNWKMGKKITVDSATMMNKGFEVIEAHYLFDVDPSKIIVLLHRSSIVHSMVEFKDHSICAQIASSDMHLPIHYAIYNKSHRKCDIIKPLALDDLYNLSFEAFDDERFPLVKASKWALLKGGIYPCVMNATNEVMVNLFLNGKVAFPDIERTIIEELDNSLYEKLNQNELTIELLEKVDRIVREEVYKRKVG